MRVLQPAEWSKPRGFSHGVVVDGPGKWVVLAGQTGGDEKGNYAPDLATQVGTALKRIVKLLAEAGAEMIPWDAELVEEMQALIRDVNKDLVLETEGGKKIWDSYEDFLELTKGI